MLPDMHNARYGGGAATIGGLVYMMGGRDKHSFLKSAECYDPSAAQWRSLPDMSGSRWGFGVSLIE